MQNNWLFPLCVFTYLSIASGATDFIQPPSFANPDERNSATINAAIEQCRKGDTLRLPAGTFDLRESVRMKSGIKLLGAGQDKTIFTYSGEKSDPFIIVSDCEDVEIGHLTLDGRNRPLGQDGIRAGNSRRLNLHHLTIRDLAKSKSAFVHAVIFSGQNPTMERGVTDSVIADCLIERVGLGAEYGGGIRLAWGSARNRVERNVIRGTGRGGIFGDHSAELVIRENRVSGSGGEGLGIEIWGGCPRSLIEDNSIDHWLSVDKGDQSAVRRNVVGADDGTLKYIGIEIIARDVVVTDNVIKRGALIGLSVSNKPVKNNVYWGYNTVNECVQWGAQFQGETGGIAHHYLYRCTFEKIPRGDPRAIYPQDSGHGFRFNGSCRGLAFAECAFGNNGGFGVQFGGEKVDAITFLGCVFANNSQGLSVGLSPDKTVEFKNCTAGSGKAVSFPATKAFSGPVPTADFQVPQEIRAGAAAQFECISKPGTGDIVERLWDFNHGIPEITANPTHTFEKPGRYRVTLVVWDSAGRGARAEKTIEVLPGQ
jgi:parallel beta-helix repeat protein